jgi:hypothetical protein
MESRGDRAEGDLCLLATAQAAGLAGGRYAGSAALASCGRALVASTSGALYRSAGMADISASASRLDLRGMSLAVGPAA